MRFLLTAVSAAVVTMYGVAALAGPVRITFVDTPPPPGVTSVHERTAPVNDAAPELCYYVWTRGCA